MLLKSNFRTLTQRHKFIERLVLPLGDRLTRSKFWSIAKGMQQAGERSFQQQRSRQTELLKYLLSVAANDTDFWKSRFVSNDASERPLELLSSLLPVTKSELEAGFPDQVVCRSVDQGDLRFAATRGTTQRMICVHDFAKRDSIRAAMVRTLHASGYRIGMPMVEIPPDICDVVCGDQGEQDKGVLRHVYAMIRGGRLGDASAYRDLRGLIERHWIYNRKTYPSFGFHGSNPPNEELDAYIDRLSKDRPYVLKGLTTYLYQIAQRLLERGDVQLQIPVIKPLGSGVTPVMRKIIEAGFDGRFHDDYGSAELGSIACDCEISNGMHIFSDLFIVEIVDSDGQTVSAGQLGEVVVTDLVNQAMPLIRYKIGDLGRIDNSPCSCGLNSPRLWIEGRIQDALTHADGQWVTSFDIAEKLYSEPGVDQFQLVEKRGDVLELTVVESSRQKLDQASLQKIIAELLGTKRKLRIRTARTLASEPGGKFRWVKAI